MNKLSPNSKEQITLSDGKVVNVPKCSLNFTLWKGRKIKNTYRKTVIDFCGSPLYAELAILRFLKADGWDGVWVDNYRNKYRVTLPELQQQGVPLPYKQAKIMAEMRVANGGRRGCWDVFAWKKNKIIFVEAKRLLKDSIRSSQKIWLGTALRAGYSLSNFLLFEWDLDNCVDGRERK